MKTAKVGKDSVAQLGMDEEEEDVKERKPLLQKLESIVVPQESVVKRYLQFNGKLSNLVLHSRRSLSVDTVCLQWRRCLRGVLDPCREEQLRREYIN